MRGLITRSIAVAALAAGAAWAQPVAITTTSPLPPATIGATYSQTFGASGGSGSYTWSASGQPGWLSMTAAGVLGGLPPSTAIDSTFTVTVTDANDSTNFASGQFTLPLALAIATPSPLPPGTVGVNYSQPLTAIGGSGTYTWVVSVGSLPGGLSLNPATGLISGQPTTAIAAASFTIQATDTNLATGSKQFALTINPAIVVTTNSPLPQGTVGVNYSQGLTASGGSGTYTWAVSVGSLPGGLSLNPATGLISGQPTTAAAAASFTIQATDTNLATGSKQFALTINPAIVITTSSPLPAGTVGVNYSQSVTASGGSGTYTWAVSVGSLPGGLSLNTATGLISGQPTTAAAAANFTIQATDTNQATGSKQFSLTINAAVVVTTNSPLPQGTVGANYSQGLTASGGSGTYTWAVSVGSLPGGLSLNPATGLISGQPTTAISAASFTIQATDTNQATGSKQFSLTINPAIVITTGSPLPIGTVGANYSQSLTASGGSGTYTWAVSVGSLPGGLSLNPATGLIGGQPTTAIAAASFTIQATDTNQATASKQFSLTINPALVITTGSPLPAGTVGVNYSQSLTATGGSGSYTWSVSAGTLPGGLTLNPATGLIAGLPNIAATSPFTIQVTDSNQVTAASPFVLTIDAPLAITTSSPLANGVVGAVYNQTLTGSGGDTPYTWSVTTGSLPGGLSLASSTGVISGTPKTTGAFPFTIQLSDSTTPANTVTKPFAITVAPFTITTSPTLPNATVGVPYTETLVAAGGVPPYVSWAITKGSLPAQLSLNSTTGTISGAPGAIASATFTVQVTDSASNTASQSFTLAVVRAPVFTTASLPNGTAGVVYLQTLAASGGTMPYTWTVVSGSLPGGLTLSSTAGTIAGNPSAAGTSNFTIQLTDATGVTARQAFVLTIVAALTISTTSPLPTGEAAIKYSQTLTAAGGTPPYTWSVIGGAVPPGLTLAAGGLLAGTPDTPGTFNFMAQATDKNNVTASATFAMAIAGVLGISTSPSLDGGSLNVVYSQSLTASPGVGPYAWSVAGGALPAGLNLSAAGVISGVPTATGTFAFTAKVADALGAAASRQFTVVIATGLAIATPPILPVATVGVAYSDLLQASGGNAPYTWAVTAGLPPPGLSLGSNGRLTGTPTAAAGPDSFTVQVTDNLGHHATEQLSITVAPELSITTGALPSGTVGAAYAQSLAATGGTPPYTWSLQSGSLPGGLTLSARGSITGTVNAAGTFSFTIKVTDSAAYIATKQLSVIVAAGPLTIVSAAVLPNASVTASYSQTLAASGGAPPYTWSLTAGALPAGLTLSAAGAIAGAPTATGTFQFTATVTDSAAGKASQQFTLIVGGGLAIAQTTLPNGSVGSPYSQTLTATGGTPPYTFTTNAGSLPPGITLKGAVLSGTPTKTGAYGFTIQVTDSVSATATEQFTIEIGTLAITTAALLPDTVVGTAYAQTLAATGGTPPYTWALTGGALPAGLSLSAAGAITGTSTVAGSFQFTAAVTDSAATIASLQFTLASEISASFTGIPSTAASAQQLSGTLTLGATYPQGIAGQVTLAFQPDASLASPADDPSIQFSTGGTALSFTIPAGSTTPVPFTLQTGTVAGTITLTIGWQAGGAALPVPAALTQTIRIAPAVPFISAIGTATTTSGFQVLITAFSNTREVSQAVLQFTAATGQTLQTTSLTVSLTSAATTWFQTSGSDQYGGQFILTLPFTVTDGSAGAIGSVSLQLVNSQGTSTATSATL